MIDLSNIIIKADGGGANMGLLAEPLTSTLAHFNLNDTPHAGRKFCLVWVRIHFSGTGASLADVQHNAQGSDDVPNGDIVRRNVADDAQCRR